MKEKLIEILEANGAKIATRWKSRLATNLKMIGRDPPSIPEELISYVFAEFLLRLRLPEPTLIQFVHESFVLGRSKGLPSKLPYQLKILFTGEEVLEDFLVDHDHGVGGIPDEDRAHYLEDIHRLFHNLVCLELHAFCGNCVCPIRDKARHIVELTRAFETQKEAS